MSPTHSPLSHPGGAQNLREKDKECSQEWLVNTDLDLCFFDAKVASGSGGIECKVLVHWPSKYEWNKVKNFIKRNRK